MPRSCPRPIAPGTRFPTILIAKGAGFASVLALPALLIAAPVARNDSYAVDEDEALSISGGGILVEATFDASGTAIGGTWDYLDRIENENGASQDYPVDGSGNGWNSVEFEVSTSTIGPWGSGSAPLQGGVIDGFDPGTPEVLGGIGAAGNGENLITTYLFRHDFSLDAAAALQSDWQLEYLVDDGAVFHLNGEEIFRTPNMQAGPVATSTFSGLGDETTTGSVVLDLSGKIREGDNTLAVEVHQTAVTSSDVGMLVTLSPAAAAPTNGFSYADDTFNGTTLPDFATGSVDNTGGFDGAGLFVQVGARTGNNVGTSGGWSRSFNLDTPATATVSFRYRLTHGQNHESDESGEAVFELDGTRYGNGPGDSLSRITGNGNGGGDEDTGWQDASFDIPLATGEHTIVLGAYSSKSTEASELTRTWFDDVVVSIPATGVGVLQNDVGDSPIAVLDDEPTHGTLVLNENGSFIYQPDPDYTGPDSFTYHANDATGDSGEATVSITVRPVNDLPVAQPDSYSGTENAVISRSAPGILQNDGDAEDDTLGAVLEDDVMHGILRFNADGSFRYTPTQGFFGTDSFTYRADDGEGTSAPVVVSLEVAPINDPPTAADDEYVTVENTPLSAVSGGVNRVVFSSDFNGATIPAGISGAGSLAGVEGYDGIGPAGNRFSGQLFRNAATGDPAAATTLTLANLPPHETLSIRFLLAIIDSWDGSDDDFIVTLDGVEIFNRAFQNFAGGGGQTFLYPAGSLLFRNQEVAFSNDGNTFRDAGYNMAREPSFRDIPHTAPTATISWFSSGSDWDGGDDESWGIDNLEVSVSGAAVETVVAAGSAWSFLDDGSNQGTAWRDPRFDDSSWDSGPALLGYGDGDVATTVSFGGDAGDKHITTYFRRRFNVTDADEFGDLVVGLIRDDGGAVYLNGTLVAIDNLDVDATSATPANLNPGLTNERTWSEFTVPAGLLQEGANVLAVEVHQDDPGSSDISMDLYLLGKRVAGAGVLANDSDPENDPLTVELVTGPQHGTLVFNENGTFLYTPDLNYEGADSFTYLADDGEFQSDPATVSLTVTSGPNDLPVTAPDSYPATEDAPLIIAAGDGVLENDTDPDGESLSATLVTPPAHGTLALTAGGGFTYAGERDYFGTDTFTYLATDGIGSSPPESVTITVSPVNDRPTAVEDRYLASPGEDVVVTSESGVLANDSDPDNPALTAVLISPTTSGDLDLDPDGSFSYVPNGGFSGTDTFTYEATDGVLTSVTTTATIRVNSPPNADNDTFSTSEDTPILRSAAQGVLRNDDDTDPLTAVLVTSPSHGTLSLSTDGSFVYVPERDFNGSDSFTYRASDSLQESNVATVNLSISPSNDEPRTEDDSYDVDVDQLLVIDSASGVLSNDVDIDSPSLVAALVDDVTNGTLVLSPNGSFTYRPNGGFAGMDTFTYEASDGIDESGLTNVEIRVQSPSKSIVINEIMYHPSSENDLHEYIELINIGRRAVNLRQWSFAAGVQFTFPSVQIQPGGFLVIAADLDGFEAAYGRLPNVIAGWTGKLSNSGERLQLVDDLGEQIDEVRYYDQGDWASRRRGNVGGEAGWSWVSDADGQGSSLELINPELSNRPGQNWAASLNNTPTPSAANSTAQNDIAPMILDVEHVPAVPTSSDPIGIVAELRDETDGPLTAILHYRISASNPGAFTAVAMFDDGYNCDTEAGDGIYGYMLPAMPDGTIIEFYVESSDGVNTRTWPAPASNGQTANALLQVDDEANTFDHGFYRIILPVSEYNQWQGINRGSNAMMNATLILDDGSGPKIRYLAGMRVRGAGSRSHTPAPMRIALPRDNDWNNSSRMNLNTRFTYLQFVGMKLFQASGMRAPDTYRVQVRINGNNIARNDGFDRGSIVHVQPLSGEFIDDKFPDDSDGNLYKKVRPDRDLRWRDGNVGGYEGDGWSKETNSSENDWSDLDTFLGVMNNADGDPDYLDQVEAVADLDQWMNWFGAMTILANGETNISNGADDDFSMYRGVLNPRFVFVPHDLDTILSFGDGSRITDPQHTLFDMIERGDEIDPLQPLFQDASIVDRYYRAMRQLLQTSFSETEFNELVENSLRDWVPEGSIEQIRTFMNERRDFINGEISPVIGPPTALPAATSSSTVTSAHGPLHISEVLAINDRTRTIDGTHPDAIELHNSGPVDLPLAGISLSDDPLVPDKFVFPPGRTIASGGYLIVWAGDPLPTPGYYAGFTLDGEGEVLSLYDAPSRGGGVLDTIAFGVQIPDFSIGRTGPGTTTWELCRPTLGGPNTRIATGDPSQLSINEWMSQHAERFEEDFVEIHNPETEPVALGALFLTDDPVSAPEKHQIAALSFVAPRGYAVFFPVGNSANPARADEIPFRLSSENEWIALRGENSVPIDQVHFVNQRADISRGRVPDGGSVYESFVAPTPGFSNSDVLTNEALLLESLRISEIMYDPPGGSDEEFIELRNIGTEAINLLGVRFTEGIRFDFPDMILQPGEFVLVVANPAAFEALYGDGLNVAGQYTGKLNNGGERLRLEVSSIKAGIHDFKYDNNWFPATQGTGFSLEIVDLALGTSAWAEKQNWTRSLAINGTPGNGGVLGVRPEVPVAISLPEVLSLVTNVTYGPHSPASVSFQWQVLSGPGAVTFSDPQEASTGVSFAQPGLYTLRLEASAPGVDVSQSFVLPVYDTYEAWVLRNFGAEIPGVTEKDSDSDGDGISNLLEFALLMNPLVPDAESFPVPVFDPGDDVLTLTYSKNFVDPATFAIEAETSDDLLAWIGGPANVSEEVIADNFGLQIIRASSTVAVSSQDTNYIRLRVSCLNFTVLPGDLQILRITEAPANPAITFTSEVGRRYQLETTLDPTAGWTLLGTPVTAALSVTTLRDANGSNDPVRLYRVRRLAE